MKTNQKRDSKGRFVKKEEQTCFTTTLEPQATGVVITVKESDDADKLQKKYNKVRRKLLEAELEIERLNKWREERLEAERKHAEVQNEMAEHELDMCCDVLIWKSRCATLLDLQDWLVRHLSFFARLANRHGLARMKKHAEAMRKELD